MDFFETVSKRRSIRRFNSQPVPHEDVLAMLEAATSAPSATNEQPWHFIVVQDKETIEKLAGRRAWAADAPVIIVGLANSEASPMWCYNDLAIAFEQIVLAATDQGLGTCWMGLMRRDSEIRELLGIPNKFKVVAQTPIGYPDEVPRPKERKPLKEIVSWGRYGEATEND